ncbi:MAG TPA: hypothetical protein VEL11_00420 [Candidatus Bathyarchaeia archaeon]|nr:hypothetical protein [Candidatus Bathyarchaeia archaeon]
MNHLTYHSLPIQISVMTSSWIFVGQDGSNLVNAIHINNSNLMQSSVPYVLISDEGQEMGKRRTKPQFGSLAKAYYSIVRRVSLYTQLVKCNDKHKSNTMGSFFNSRECV